MTWDTRVINQSGTAITVNGAALAEGRTVLLRANHDVTVVLPEVGTARFTEPGSDNFHQYIPTTWAVKVIAGGGSYVRYWGYEGGPTLTVTVNDDRTFSLPASCNISFEGVPFDDHPLTQYTGVYSTNTQWWGDYFSPMFINDDGTMSFGDASTTITPRYNSTTASISFDATHFKDTTFRANFSIVGAANNLTLSGGLFPRPQDGAVNFAGTLLTLFKKPSLGNIRAFDSFLKDGDIVDFRSQPAHLPLVLDAQQRLTQAQSGNPVQLTVKFFDGMSGFALLNAAAHVYLTADDSGQIFSSAGQEDASMFHLYICMDGDVMVGTGDQNVPASNQFMKRDPSTGLIGLSQTTFLNSDREFLMSFPEVMRQQPANRAAQTESLIATATADTVGDPLPCEIVNLQILAHCTVGLLPVLGLGQFTFTGQVQRRLQEIWASSDWAIKTALEAFKAQLINAGVTKMAFAGFVVQFVTQIYEAAPDLMNKLLRTAWEYFGWWNFAKAAAWMASMFLLPENPLAVSQIIANLTQWILTAYGMRADAGRCLLTN